MFRALTYIGRMIALVFVIFWGIAGPIFIISVLRDGGDGTGTAIILIPLFPYAAWVVGKNIINRERRDRGMEPLITPEADKAVDDGLSRVLSGTKLNKK